MSKRGFIGSAVVILIGLLVVAGLIVLGINIGKKSSAPTTNPVVTVQPSPVASPTADETANWKTYTGNNFTFKYPADKYTIEERVKGYYAVKPINEISGFAGIMIDDRMLSGSYDKVVSDLKQNLVNPKVKALTNGVKISGTFGAPKQPGASLEGTEIIEAYLKNNSSYVQIETTDKSSFATFDQILSTFKFTN